MKPTIIIKSHHPNPIALKEILAGIEEEGILYSLIEETSNFDCYRLASDGAKLSKIQVGIGINKDLAALYVHKTRDILLAQTNLDYRLIGQNASRYVKGNPFITDP